MSRLKIYGLFKRKTDLARLLVPAQSNKDKPEAVRPPALAGQLSGGPDAS